MNLELSMLVVRTLSETDNQKPIHSPVRERLRTYPIARWTTWVAFIEFCVICASAYLASAFYPLLTRGDLYRTDLYLLFSLFLGLFYLGVCVVDNQYDFYGKKWRRDGISRSIAAIALAFAFFLSLVFVFNWNSYFSRGTFLTQLIFVTLSISITRVLLAQRLDRAVKSRQLEGRGIVVISLSPDCGFNTYASKLSTGSDKIVRWYDFESSHSSSRQKKDRKFADKIERIRNTCRAEDIDLVIVIYDSASQANIEQIVEAFYELPVHIQLLPIGMVPYMRRSRVTESGEFVALEIQTQPFSTLDRYMKRSLDLAVATLGIILFSPLLLLVSVAIKLDSPGPVLFRQKRHGFNNEPINVLKFRTMKTSNAIKGFRQTSREDPRVTTIGRLLRKTSIDELPQLFNVVRGEMSIVGPRPHATVHNEAFASEIKMIYRRHNVKPGITGWAQVNGLRGATNTCEQMQKRIQYDLYYVDNWSIFLDIKIILLTALSSRTYSNAY